jgi:hypothetical protein
VSDTFGKLLAVPKLVCDNIYHGNNFVYSIAARIGTHELISTFVDLNKDTLGKRWS